MNNADWIEVYRAKDVVEANLFCDALQEAGVPAMVDGEWLSNSAGSLTLGWSTLPRILCPPDLAEKARGLLEDFETQELQDSDDDDSDDADGEDAEETPEE